MGEKIILFNSLPPSLISGGNIYNHHLIKGLNDLGCRAREETIATSQDWIDGLEEDSIYLLDSILLNDKLDWDQLRKYKVMILLHMCPSLGSDLSKEEKALIDYNESIAYQQFPIISTGANNINYIEEQLQFRTQNTIVIHPAISADWIKRKDVSPRPSKLISLGAISADKGLRRILEVLRLIKDLDWMWNHYGPIKDSGLLDQLKELGKQYDIADRIIFNGAADHSRINELLQGQDLLLHLSDHENYGMVIQESIASGIPFMMTPVGDYHAWQNAGIGWVTQDFNTERIAVQLSNIIKDEKQYIDMTRRVQSHVLDSWNDVANRTIQFIQSNVC